MIRIGYGNSNGYADVDTLYPTNTLAYAARIKSNLMNIIRAPAGPRPISSRSFFQLRDALRAQVPVPAAITIDLLAGSIPVGSIFFTGIPDPTFAGGFAGIASKRSVRSCRPNVLQLGRCVYGR
jgi:hypothetical protein